jgi:chorismate mutase
MTTTTTNPDTSKRTRTLSQSSAGGGNNITHNEFSLSSIRDALIRQEETIIFAAIERTQWARNAKVYMSGKDSLVSVPETGDSFFQHFLYETEKLHARLGRYRAQDLEHAFFAHRNLPNPTLSRTPAEPWGKPLKSNAINLNDKILANYENEVVARLTSSFVTHEKEDDGHYGSTAVADITLIQALSYRIHYGKLVAEAKYRAQTKEFKELILKKDADGIMKKLTDEKVEQAVLDRVRAKAARYGRPTDTVSDNNNHSGMDGGYKVDPQVISDIYRDFVIPYNKMVQVQYLLARDVSED